MSPVEPVVPFDVRDLDGIREAFDAGKARQVGVVARRLLATLDAVLSSQGMVRASSESSLRATVARLTDEVATLRALLKDARDLVDCERSNITWWTQAKRLSFIEAIDAALAEREG